MAGISFAYWPIHQSERICTKLIPAACRGGMLARMIHRTASQAPSTAPFRDDGERIAELSKLLAMWPSELSDTSRQGRLKVLAKIERAIRDERRRGRAGHWAYDLARHAALFRLLKLERQALKTIT